ncbi:MAG TPA: pyruvate kinase [Patescibacteria group bacterium]|jgi:pyruvate kinase
MRNTQIVATIGPASETRAVLPKLLEAGVDVARLNFSHGDYAEFERIVKDIRAWSKKRRKVTILQDLQGPKLRVGEIAPGTRYKDGAVVMVTPEAATGDEKTIPVTYDGLAKDLKKGDTILLADGAVELEVLQAGKRDLKTKVLHGGTVGSHQGFNVPKRSLSVPAVTDKDKDDLAWGLAHEVDWVAVSFVTSADDVRRVRRMIEKAGVDKHPRIVAKIEKHEAVDNLEEIIDAADAVMVARGDLGVEIDPAEVPFAQKEIIHHANAAAKPVITATQMLKSMTDAPRPTRAEVSDVANAVLDGSDAVMLSEESAVGTYPVEAVRTMAHVIDDTERLFHRHRERLGL